MLSPDEAYSRLAASYDTLDNPVTALGLSEIEQIGPSLTGMDVLDLGCGTGSVARRAASFRPRSWIGLDRVPEMLKQATRPAVRGDLEYLPFASHSFDVVLFWVSLGYVESPDRALLESKRVLRPSGRVFVLDLHPLGRERGWKRNLGGIEIRSVIHPRGAWTRAFDKADLDLVAEHTIRIDATARDPIERAGGSFRKLEGLELLIFFDLKT